MIDLPPLLFELVSPGRLDRAGEHAGRDETGALLEARGFAAHAPALDFEAAFGGVQLLEADAEPPALVVGPYACFAAAPYSKHERDLLPVMFGADDTVYSLDGRGRGWTCAAMVDGSSRPSARDGAQLLAQAILWRVLSTGSSVARAGAVGASIAADLPVLSWATSDHESWWGDESRLVVEIPYGNGYTGPMTYVFARRAASP